MSISKEGSLKIKLQHQTKWHRRYCIIDWDKSILFIATRIDTRYRDWIKLVPNILINECDCISNGESNTHLSSNTIELKIDNGTTTHLLQAESKRHYDGWLLALKRTAYSRVGGGIFGQSLEDTYRYSLDKVSLVPLIVRQCCEYLLEYGSTFVGLFRVPGKQSSIKELRDIYDRGVVVDLKTSYSPATVSSLLKTYLQSLPEPIIPPKYFDHFLEIGSRFKYNQTSDLNRLKQLMEGNLSTTSYATLAYLCLFLKKLTDHVQVTKMDTDNLAVVFGNNLIRPAEELDLNMIKGHNYNLLPLIKAFIDHSEYLFSNTSMNQYQDSSEQTTESATKSSGFSSFSSLLSTNESSITKNSRSSSMPSIYMAGCSSHDNEDTSLESRQFELNKMKRRPESFVDKQNSLASDRSNILQSSFETDEIYVEKKASFRQQRFPSTDVLEDSEVPDRMKHNPRSMDDISREQKMLADHRSCPMAIRAAPISIRKMEKYPPRKSFANKFGKSLNSLKSSMSKALQPHASSNEQESHDIDTASSMEYKRTSIDSQSSTNTRKKLQKDIDVLQELLEKKDLLIMELTNNSRDERLEFEKMKWQLNEKIEQLENENVRLKGQLNMQ